MANNDLNIKPLTEADYEEWLLLWHNYLNFYQTSLPKEISENTWFKINEPKKPIWYSIGKILENKKL